MPQLCVGNQAHPHDWDVASCSRKYKYDINSLFFEFILMHGTLLFALLNSALLINDPLCEKIEIDDDFGEVRKSFFST